MTYNGWANYGTWLINLHWGDDDQWIDEQYEHLAQTFQAFQVNDGIPKDQAFDER